MSALTARRKRAHRVRVASVLGLLFVAALAGAGLTNPAPVAAMSDPECETSDSCATLTVAFTGYAPGHGAGPGMVNCLYEAGVTTGNCSYEYYVSGASRSITVTGWGDHVRAYPCYGTTCATVGNTVNPVIVLTPGSRKTVTFDIRWLYPTAMSVTKLGTGTGQVVSAPAGINCGTTCTWTFSGNSGIDLTFIPTGGSTFGGWSGGAAAGGCVRITDFSCHIAVDTDTGGATIFATFNAPATPAPTATAMATPHATATASPLPTPTASPKATSTTKPSPTPTTGASAGPSAGPGQSAVAVPTATAAGASPDPNASAEASIDPAQSPIAASSGSPGPSSVAGASPTTSPGQAGDPSTERSDSTPLLLLLMLVLVIVAFVGGNWFSRRQAKRSAS